MTFASQVRLAARLARRELRGGVAGFRIFLACLALGVAAIASVGSISAALTAGMRNDAKIILGGDVDLRLSHRPPSAAQREWLTANGAISETRQFRSMAIYGATFGATPGVQRALIEVKAVDAVYPLFGRAVLSTGQPLHDAIAEHNGRHGIVVEGRLLEKTGAKVGETLRIGDAVLRIAATLDNEPDRAAQGFTLGPRVMMSMAALDATGLVKPGSLIRYHTRVAIADSVSVEDWRASLHDRFPKAGWRVRDMRDAAPGVRRLIERVTMFMTLAGLTALLVGGVGVGNSVRAFLGAKTNVIATLKCIGGDGGLINAVYFLQIAAIATLGVAIGLALGAVAPTVLLPIIGARLPVQAAMGLYAEPLMLAAAYGYLATLAFSLAPLAHARTVPAARLFRDVLGNRNSDQRASRFSQWRLAGLVAATTGVLGVLTILTASDRWIAAYFVLGAIAAFAIFHLVAILVGEAARRAPRPKRTQLRMALANIHRPGATTTQIVVSLGLGLTVLVAIAQVEGNLTRLVANTVPQNAPSYFFIDIQPDQTEAFDRLTRNFDGVTTAAHVPMLRGRIITVNGVPADKIKPPPNYTWILRGGRGLTWSATPPATGSAVVEGDWWPPDYAGPPLLSFDAKAAKGLGVGIGNTIGLNVLGREITARIANLRSIEWASFGINFVMILSPGVLDGAPQSHIATARVAPEREAALESAVLSAFPNVSAIRIKDILTTLQDMIAALGQAVRVIAIVALVSGALVLAGAVAASQQRRIYDAVVLKVLGATRREILAMLVMEFAVLGVVTGIIAAAFGALAAWGVVTQLLASQWHFLPDVALVTIVACAVATVIAGLLGTGAALGRKAAPLLRNR
ncbi:MAG: FtsX-like permease family protein [Rhodospirillaceae bacterium]|nr:FtsX-like permease family protein [Rhodospirillaceae bacterium]